jgi:hypothetical protein
LLFILDANHLPRFHLADITRAVQMAMRGKSLMSAAASMTTGLI